MPTYKVEVGPHYTPSSDVYTIEADDEEEARGTAVEEAASDWAQFEPEFVVTSVEEVPDGDS